VSWRRRWSLPARLFAVALVAALPVLAPVGAAAEPPGAGPGLGGPDVTAGASPAPDRGGSDLLKATGSDLTGALDQVDAKVEAQVTALSAARRAERQARAAMARADADVATTRKRITALTEQSDRVVIDAFVDPPTASALDVLASGSTADATVKQAILDRQSDADADVLTRLEAARSTLDAQRRARQRAADRAGRRADDAREAVADLVEAQSQESLFVVAVQDRMADELSEAEALARLDPRAAAALRARQRQLAGKIDQLVAARRQREAEAALTRAMQAAAARAADAAAAQAQARADARSAPGAAQVGLGTVACPGGGSITVAASITGNLRSMLAAAAADGLPMCGGGYRDPADQVALRRAHCGSSQYAIYEAPASACSPPTARPGASLHEQGLAVDITCGGGTISQGSACYAWLSAHAGAYGFSNLPSEAWHWSTDGR
jgi:LAS superfamily LD-carboxypeptidase LdcB